MNKLFGVFASVVALVAEVPDARADHDAARPHVEAGVAAYDAKDFTAASREFEAAYALDPDPSVLYAWAQSLRLAKRCAEAIPIYRRYLATKPNEAQITAATTGIASCAQAQASSPVGPPTRAPAPAPIAAEPAADPWYRDTLGVSLVVGGVLSLGAGATFLALSYRTEAKAANDVFRDDYINRLEDATWQRRVGVVGLGVGGVLIAAGIVRYVSRGNESRVTIVVAASSLGLQAHF